MTDLREMIWQQASEVLFIEREDYMRWLDEWEIEPIEIDGKAAFAMLVKGPAIHLASFRTGHRFPLKRFTARVRELLAEHGHVETRTPRHEVQQQALNERFGFRRIGEDDYDVIYRLEGAPQCQSQQ